MFRGKVGEIEEVLDSWFFLQVGIEIVRPDFIDKGVGVRLQQVTNEVLFHGMVVKVEHEFLG